MLPEYPEARRRAFARNVLERTLRLRRGESLLIETWSGTLDWAESAVLEARRIGARTLLVVEDESTYWKSVREAPTTAGLAGAHEWAALKASDAHLYFWGPSDVDREESLPSAVANRILTTDHEWFRLVEKHGVRSVRWDLGRTSEAWAQRYGVDLARWRTELIDAALVDPRTLSRDGRRLSAALAAGREVRITAPNGTDLSLRLRGRVPTVDDGCIDAEDIRAGNVYSVVPSGVVTVALEEAYVEGTFVADDAPGVLWSHGGQTPLSGGRWTFAGGRLTEFSFGRGGEAFRKEFNRAGAERIRAGLLSVGLNPAISAIPLLFDQERGALTFAIGRNAHVGGATKTPHFTAYQTVRHGSLTIDGRTWVDAGRLV